MDWLVVLLIWTKLFCKGLSWSHLGLLMDLWSAGWLTEGWPELGGTTWLCSMWALFLQEASPDLLSCRWQSWESEGEKEREKACKTTWGLVLERHTVISATFSWLKQWRPAHIQRAGKRNCTSWWEELWSHIAKIMVTERSGELELFCSHSNTVIVNRTLADWNSFQKNHLLNSDRFFSVHVKLNRWVNYCFIHLFCLLCNNINYDD